MLDAVSQIDNPHDPDEKTRRRMRWFILIILAVGFLGSVVASIVMKSPLPLSVGLLLRPIIIHFFPTPRSQSKS